MYECNAPIRKKGVQTQRAKGQLYALNLELDLLEGKTAKLNTSSCPQ